MFGTIGVSVENGIRGNAIHSLELVTDKIELAFWLFLFRPRSGECFFPFLSFFLSIIVLPQLDWSHRQGSLSCQNHNQADRWLVLTPLPHKQGFKKTALFLSDIASVLSIPSPQCCRGGGQLVAVDPNKQSSIHTYFRVFRYLTSSSVSDSKNCRYCCYQAVDL